MYYFCKHGCRDLDITYIGFDTGQPKLEIEGVKAKYISNKHNIIVRYFRLLFSYIRECYKEYDMIFIVYFCGCSLLKILHPSKRFILDIRSGSCAPNPIKRRWNDSIMRIESLFFKHISVISKSLAKKLNMSDSRVYILPLGAEPVDVPCKRFDTLNLLYVGTFSNRRMEDTIEGFALFYFEFKDSVKITYDIIGDGYLGELEQLRSLVDRLGLAEVVKLPGYVHHIKLKPYFERCNVGICYVPINHIYDCQPPTKTFEYLIAGMPVIATATSENKRVLNSSNGILIEDTSRSVYLGLKELYRRQDSYCSKKIRQNCQKHCWQRIVSNNLLPYLKTVTSG
jgi:glycosyltransferase involved in cell wall biosynthesis